MYSNSSRGRGASRGRRGTPRSPMPEPDKSFIRKDLSGVVRHFDRATIMGNWVPITDVEPITSYSWLDRENTPTIEVPGCPPTFTGEYPTQVPPDKGLRYVDQNSARVGPTISPLAPLMAAMDVRGEIDRLRDFDIISDRNTLRKLLRWVTGSADERDFRIDVDLAGRTCLFTRREGADTENVTDFRGYGKNYMKEATYPARGEPDATGHHRVISMSWGKTKILLRFELDACLPSAADAETEDEPAHREPDVDDLISAMAKLDTGASGTEATKFGIKILVEANQTLVPQDDIIEVKTRASHRALDWEETYPQLYLSQTPWLYFAKHFKGIFDPPERYELGSRSLQPHASAAQAGLGKLHSVLEALIKAVRAEGVGAELCLICEGGSLSLYRRRAGTGRKVGREILALFRN